VPAGTYSLAFSIIAPAPTPRRPFGDAVALVVKPQVSVRSDTTIQLDARTAVPYKAALANPGTTKFREDDLNIARTSLRGGGVTTGCPHDCTFGIPRSLFMGLVSFPFFGNQALYATPTPTAPATR
jgi:hypothetical protein